MKRTPLKRGKPLQRKTPLAGKPFSQLKGKKCASCLKRGHAMKRLARIKQKSAKQSKEDREYSVLRKEFLLAHPQCEGCIADFQLGAVSSVQPSTEIQHKALRGKWHNRTDTWAAVCRYHGEKCTTDPTWSYETGLRMTREEIRLLEASDSHRNASGEVFPPQQGEDSGDSKSPPESL